MRARGQTGVVRSRSGCCFAMKTDETHCRLPRGTCWHIWVICISKEDRTDIGETVPQRCHTFPRDTRPRSSYTYPTCNSNGRGLHRKTDHDRPAMLKRIRISAETAALIIDHGMKSDCNVMIGQCSALIFTFIFQCRSVSVAHVRTCDITVTTSSVSVTLTHRKAKAQQRPLRLSYPRNTESIRPGPVDLLLKWTAVHPNSSGIFYLHSREGLGDAHLRRSMEVARSGRSRSAKGLFIRLSQCPYWGLQ